MKKYYVLLMTAMMLSLAACAGNAETVSENSDSEIVEVSETVSDEDTEEVEAEKIEETVEEAIDGAKDIIAESISDEADYRIYIRQATYDEGKIISSAKDSKQESVYEMYYEFEEAVSKIF